MSWNEEKVEKLKKLWGKGSTASQIAEIIGGISRNAVIGKAHRLNLSSKIKTRNASSSQNFDNSSEENSSKQRRGRKSKFQSLIIEKDFEPENPKKLEELDESSCKVACWTSGRTVILFLWTIVSKRFFILQTSFAICLSAKRKKRRACS